MSDRTPLVYEVIASVAARLCEKGVGKTRNNAQQGYKFRGIDDFYNALAPELAKAKLCILPRCLSREVVERTSGKGTALFYVTVAMEFDFVFAEDGSKHTVGPLYGEAMDSGDKATNKAMSAAYKYAVMQAFAIPIEGQAIDSESDTHEVLPKVTPLPGPITARQTAEDAFDALDEEHQTYLRDIAMNAIARFESDHHPATILQYIDDEKMDTELRLAMWSLLPSKLRTALKIARDESVKKQKAAA